MSEPRDPAPSAQPLPARLEVSVRPAGGTAGVDVIVLAGVLDRSTAAIFKAELLHLCERNAPPRIVCDFGAVSYVASAGWGVLIGHLKRFRERKGTVRVTGLNDSSEMSFRHLGMQNFFEVCGSVAEAVARPW